MSAMAPWIPGARVVDLFAGSGALGLECLSRGAAHVTFVERARPVLRTLRSNVDALGARDQVEIVAADALRWVRELRPSLDAANRPFRLALADPPYGQGLAPELAREFVRLPFADQLWVEHERRESLGDLDPARERHYGDTVLSLLEALPSGEDPEVSPAAPDPPHPHPGDLE